MCQEEEQRKSDLLVANQQDDKMIKQLEKQLGLKKRKSKSLPSSFVNDGLGGILDILKITFLQFVLNFSFRFYLRVLLNDVRNNSFLLCFEN